MSGRLWFLPILVAFLAHGSENHACTGDNPYGYPQFG